MFEPQDHPDNIPFPGAPPTPPYDHAGWTLAFQMGVEFDRVLDGVHRTVRARDRLEREAAAGTVTSVAGDGRLSDQSSARRLVRRAQSTARRRGGRVLAAEPAHRERQDLPGRHVVRAGESIDARRAGEDRR